MTLEELLGCDSVVWESLTDTQLLEIAEKNNWLKITRPELAALNKPAPNRNHSIIPKKGRNAAMNEKLAKARQIAMELGGLDLSDIL